MFELIFGLVWTAVSSLFAFLMYGTGNSGTIMVNGEPMSHAEFNELLWPKLFIGLFILVGICLIFIGIKKFLANLATETKGYETYGIVMDIYPSGSSVNGRPILNADFIIVEENGETGTYTESIGMDRNKYKIGNWAKLKYYNKDINILEKTDVYSVPHNIKTRIENECSWLNENNREDDIDDITIKTEIADEIVINGIKYKRQD